MTAKYGKVVQAMKKIIIYLILASLLLGIAFSEEVSQPYGTDCEVGAVITFGSYEQDNDLSNDREPIEWIIIDERDDGSLVLMSKYVLDCKPYNTKYTDVTWETCTLRKWLNEDFYNAAFSAEEQTKIVPMTLENEDNLNYGTKGGNDTEDRVWLLSINEVCDYFTSDKLYTYFTSDSMRDCYPTAYAVAQGAYTYNGACFWWLRSPGRDSGFAACVRNFDFVDGSGLYVYYDADGVRPVVVALP